MPIQASCSCGHSFNAPSKYVGKKVKCPKCQQPTIVPEAKPASTQSAKIAVHCKCGKAFQAQAEWAGKKVKCPGCGSPVTIAAQQADVGASAKPASPAKSTMDDLFDEIGLAPDVDGGPGRKCPECKTPMKPEAILCIQCGYNENLGKRMEVVRPVTATDRAKRAAKQTDEMASKRKPKRSGDAGKQKLMLLAVVLIAVVALVFVAKNQGWLPQ